MNNQLKQLYYQDLNLWRQKIITAIQNRKLENMDWDNLIEEINDMGASEKRALRSYTKRLIEHILKLKYWKSEREYNQRGWKKEVVNFREEIKSILQESPSLNSYLQQNYLDWHQKSVKAMHQEFTIPDDSFVDLEIIMTDDYFGEI
ncbi:DUF29 domain-containing protein [Pleurocapsa sp. PCC 7319]|uniref:DUF29 domain-containing protein n=1 Tax=Pleurocapsa sp. PCC 7319 TaxID=118161 RepID=UPI000362DD46|nr:DUF29 domain-containing protein [Pleurocapsa sp. PCC 7319]